MDRKGSMGTELKHGAKRKGVMKIILLKDVRRKTKRMGFAMGSIHFLFSWKKIKNKSKDTTGQRMISTLLTTLF